MSNVKLPAGVKTFDIQVTGVMWARVLRLDDYLELAEAALGLAKALSKTYAPANVCPTCGALPLAEDDTAGTSLCESCNEDYPTADGEAAAQRLGPAAALANPIIAALLAAQEGDRGE